LIEYLYDTIRATAGETITLTAMVTDNDGVCVEDPCSIMIHDDNELLFMVDGTLFGDEVLEEKVWLFTIPSELTQDLNGRYWYCVCCGETRLCFKHPIYFKG
jgi:hypothetical protein